MQQVLIKSILHNLKKRLPFPHFFSMAGYALSKSRNIVIVNFLIFLIITITLSATLNIWLDEAYTLNTTNGNIIYTINKALYIEKQAPFYFALLNLWRKIDNSAFFARLFSVFCILLTLYVVVKLSRRLFYQINPAWVLASLTFNPFIIWAACNIRCYAFVILISSLLLLFFYDGYLLNINKNRARWLYVIFSVLGLYSLYYVGFLLAANAFALLFLRRWQALRAYILAMLIVGTIFLPMLLIFSQVVEIHSNTLPLIESVKQVYWRIQNYFLPNYLYGGWLYPILNILKDFIVLAGIIFTLFLLIRRNKSFFQYANISLIIIVTILSMFFIIINYELGRGYALPRHTSILFLPSILLIFSVIRFLNRKLLTSFIIVTIFFHITSLYATYKPMAKTGDWDRVASYIMQSEKPDEPILIFKNICILPFKYYYSGINQVVPIPPISIYDCAGTFSILSTVLHSEEQILNALSSNSNSYQRFWLVVSHAKPASTVKINRDILESFISKFCSVVINKNFYKSNVRYLKISPDLRLRMLNTEN